MKILFIILLFSITARATNFYVSTSGSSGNSGSLASPWDLQTAFDHPVSVNPGDQINVLAGTYTGHYTSDLTGTLANPIIIRASGRVIIDGTRLGQSVKRITVLTITGAYTWYWGLEITNTDPDRTGSFAGTDGRGAGIDALSGAGNKIINCIIYDTGDGLTAWQASTDGEYYGNVIFNNGWEVDGGGGGTGHGVYTQNNTGTKTFKDNTILQNFGFGLHAYTEGGIIHNFVFKGNTVFNDEIVFGGLQPMQDVVLDSTYAYADQVRLGYSNTNNDTLLMRGNVFPMGLDLKWWHHVTATGNLIFKRMPGPLILMLFQEATSPPDFSTYAFNNNTYWGLVPPNSTGIFHKWQNTTFVEGDAGFQSLIPLGTWRSTYGQDATVDTVLWPNDGEDSLLIRGKQTFVRKNFYDANRANVVIYNWSRSSSTNIGVAGILSTGDQYELRNVEDYFGDVITGTFAGGDSLSVPMTGHTIAFPVGYGTLQGNNTYPEFGSFVLIKTSSAAVSSPGQVVFKYHKGGLRFTTASSNRDESGYGTLVYSNGFNSGTDLDPDSHGQLGSGGFASSPKTEGSNSFHSLPANVSSGWRSEVQFDASRTSAEGVIEYDVYYESPIVQNNAHSFQFHPNTGGGSASPGLWHVSGEFQLVNWVSGTNTFYPTGVTIPADTWMTLRHEYKFGPAGYWHLYKDDVLILDINNVQIGDGSGQYFKLGVNIFSGTPASSIYYDRLRIWQK